MDSDRIKGKVKEGEGRLTGDPERADAGRAQQTWGQTKEKAGDAWDDTKDKLDDAKDKLT